MIKPAITTIGTKNKIHPAIKPNFFGFSPRTLALCRRINDIIKTIRPIVLIVPAITNAITPAITMYAKIIVTNAITFSPTVPLSTTPNKHHHSPRFSAHQKDLFLYPPYLPALVFRYQLQVNLSPLHILDDPLL